MRMGGRGVVAKDWLWRVLSAAEGKLLGEAWGRRGIEEVSSASGWEFGG